MKNIGALVIGTIGIGTVWYGSNWIVAVGLFLCLWGHNLEYHFGYYLNKGVTK